MFQVPCYILCVNTMRQSGASYVHNTLRFIMRLSYANLKQANLIIIRIVFLVWFNETWDGLAVMYSFSPQVVVWSKIIPNTCKIVAFQVTIFVDL